jgi:hypothetical protein
LSYEPRSVLRMCTPLRNRWFHNAMRDFLRGAVWEFLKRVSQETEIPVDEAYETNINKFSSDFSRMLYTQLKFCLSFRTVSHPKRRAQIASGDHKDYRSLGCDAV